MKLLSNAKEITVTFRWLVILLLLLFILYSPRGFSPTAYRWMFILFLVFIVSNTFLSMIRVAVFLRYRLSFYVFLVDIFLISFAIYIIQGFDSDLYLIYFIVIFIATLSSTGLKRSLTIGLIAALLYFGFYLRTNPVSSLWSSYMLLRIPFFFLLAFISTFHSEQLRTEIVRRQRAEEKIEQVLDQYKTLVHTIPDIIYELDDKGRFIFVSDAIQQFGYTSGDLVGQHFSILIHPEDRASVSREAVLEKYKAAPPEGREGPKLFDERRTGNRMTKHLQVRLLLKQPQGVLQPLIYAEVHASGKWTTDGPSGAKKVTGTIGIIRDVTENARDKQAIEEKNAALEAMNADLASTLQRMEKAHEELKQAQSQLLQSEKLASIGQLAAGIAHEINNPLAYVISNVEVLGTHLEQYGQVLRQINALQAAQAQGDEARIRKAIQAIADLGRGLLIPSILGDIEGLTRGSTDGLARIKKIIKDLNTFSRKDEEERIPSDLNAILDGVLGIVWNEMKYKAELKKDFGKIPVLDCNPQQIGQVILNILLNAVQSLDGMGTITVRTRAEGNRAVIEISDTGQGIAPEDLARVFEPFYTTKPAGKGTGLGLSISLDIVRRHGGTIEVNSEPGQGSTFRISLPC